jgi:hypothetical protein
LQREGFTSSDVRDAFEVFEDYSFYYHCYFIYGNIGESRDEMLYIPLFAKEIGADSISYQKLQARKFSPIREVVEKTSGYYLGSNQHVYSDRYSMDDLNRIRKEIQKKFYTPKQFYHIVAKAYKIKCFTLRDLAWFTPRIPLLLYRLVKRKMEKRKRRKMRRLRALMKA